MDAFDAAGTDVGTDDKGAAVVAVERETAAGAAGGAGGSLGGGSRSTYCRHELQTPRRLIWGTRGKGPSSQGGGRPTPRERKYCNAAPSPAAALVFNSLDNKGSAIPESDG